MVSIRGQILVRPDNDNNKKEGGEYGGKGGEETSSQLQLLKTEHSSKKVNVPS